MIIRRFVVEDFNQLTKLQIAYKQSINEEMPDQLDFERLQKAISYGQIEFFVVEENNALIAMCSTSKTFSTFNYRASGVFEDFYVLPEYRHQGIAKRLVKYAYDNSEISSLAVGCANCDVEMYKALGFCIQLGNLLAYDN